MQAATSSSQALRRLSEVSTDGHRVLSVYLSLDPSQYPNLRERHVQLDALLAEVEQRDAGENGSHRDRMELREDIERIRGLLGERQLGVPSAHGLAVFSSVGAGILEVVPLGSPVKPTVALGERPLVEPLLQAVPAERWCVLLVSRRAARILHGTRDRLVEAEAILDEVHGRHDQGGWSQARFQRGIEKEVDDHLRATCAVLLEDLGHHAFDRLLIGGPAELHARLEEQLHADLRARLAGRFEIDVERATVDEVHRKALPLMDREEGRREREAIERLREGMAPGGHAAAGVEEVLGLLGERRVQALLICPDLPIPGFECPSCGRLSAHGGPCPVDGADQQPRDDLVERAVALARGQSAEVLIIGHEPHALDDHGGIAAIARF